MEKRMCPSMMCADHGCLGREVELLEAAGADAFHVDIMDGRFVPNFSMGMPDLEYILHKAAIPVEVHLMVAEPARCLRLFARAGVSVLYVHPEADPQPARTLQDIAGCGITPGIALNPGTPVAMVEPLLHVAGAVLAMTVNPGFAGQAYLPWVDEKLALLAKLKRRFGFSLAVDGACSPHVIERTARMGVDGFVLGTSALFGQGRPYAELVPGLRALAMREERSRV